MHHWAHLSAEIRFRGRRRSCSVGPVASIVSVTAGHSRDVTMLRHTYLQCNYENKIGFQIALLNRKNEKLVVILWKSQFGVQKELYVPNFFGRHYSYTPKCLFARALCLTTSTRPFINVAALGYNAHNSCAQNLRVSSSPPVHTYNASNHYMYLIPPYLHDTSCACKNQERTLVRPYVQHRGRIELHSKRFASPSEPLR